MMPMHAIAPRAGPVRPFSWRTRRPTSSIVTTDWRPRCRGIPGQVFQPVRGLYHGVSVEPEQGHSVRVQRDEEMLPEAQGIDGFSDISRIGRMQGKIQPVSQATPSAATIRARTSTTTSRFTGRSSHADQRPSWPNASTSSSSARITSLRVRLLQPHPGHAKRIEGEAEPPATPEGSVPKDFRTPHQAVAPPFAHRHENRPPAWPPSWPPGPNCPRRSRPASWRWSRPPRERWVVIA